MTAAPDPIALTLAEVMRADRGRILAALIARVRDFQLAEDALQDAAASALVHWSKNGAPSRPEAWLIRVAFRKAIDRLRRARNFAHKAQDYGLLLELDAMSSDADDKDTIPDERLRLIFTCCHPALDVKTRVALTLRTLCGLTTPEIARAFLDTEDAMAQRLVRAHHKIIKAGIPFEIPGVEALPERLEGVRAVIYLVFNEGYCATVGEQSVRTDLCEEAIRLARLLDHLQPGAAESEGLLALLLLNHARRHARRAADGSFVPLDSQNRDLWDRALIDEGTALLDRALRRHHAGPYQLQAAISALHAQAPDHAQTRWGEIVLLYDGLYAQSANLVYLLNQAVALSYAQGPQAGLNALAPLEGELAAYQPLHAARADFLRRLGRKPDAAAAYARAIDLSHVASERAFLEGRLATVQSDRPEASQDW